MDFFIFFYQGEIFMEKLYSVFFSPTDTTRGVLDFLAAGMQKAAEDVDLTSYQNKDLQKDFTAEDTVLIGVPSYAGRVPETFAQRFKENIKGNNTPAVIVITFGNRAYEDTLIELIRNRLKDREQTRKRYMQAGSVPIPEEVTYSAADEAFLAKLNQVINNNLDNCDLDIATLCKEVHMSRASLYNKLKALTNISANEYINKFRMEKAIQLIVHTDMPFTEIAEKTGFATSSYFSTAFKQYTGETPTQYKKRIRQENAAAQ